MYHSGANLGGRILLLLFVESALSEDFKQRKLFELSQCNVFRTNRLSMRGRGAIHINCFVVRFRFRLYDLRRNQGLRFSGLLQPLSDHLLCKVVSQSNKLKVFIKQ